MRLRINYKEMKDYPEPFTAVVDRGNGLEIWNYKTGLDAEKHKAWLYKKGIPTSYVELFDNEMEAQVKYPEAETHGEQIKSGRSRTEKKIQKEENEFTIKLDANTSQVLKTIAKVTGLTVEEIIVRIIKKETRPNE